jgi:branched-chain amino acid transport system substrate-binding protein
MKILSAALLAVAGLAEAALTARAAEPIKIGFSMELTGPLAVIGETGLLAFKIWEDEVNAEGGLLGRPVKLVYYDDQSNPALVPGIYTKLIDIDKVNLWEPVPTMQFPGVMDFIKKYQARAPAEGVDLLG